MVVSQLLGEKAVFTCYLIWHLACHTCWELFSYWTKHNFDAQIEVIVIPNISKKNYVATVQLIFKSYGFPLFFINIVPNICVIPNNRDPTINEHTLMFVMQKFSIFMYCLVPISFILPLQWHYCTLVIYNIVTTLVANHKDVIKITRSLYSGQVGRKNREQPFFAPWSNWIFDYIGSGLIRVCSYIFFSKASTTM
jgi:hypothetical protein